MKTPKILTSQILSTALQSQDKEVQSAAIEYWLNDFMKNERNLLPLSDFPTETLPLLFRELINKQDLSENMDEKKFFDLIEYISTANPQDGIFEKLINLYTQKAVDYNQQKRLFQIIVKQATLSFWDGILECAIEFPEFLSIIKKNLIDSRPDNTSISWDIYPPEDVFLFCDKYPKLGRRLFEKMIHFIDYQEYIKEFLRVERKLKNPKIKIFLRKKLFQQIWKWENVDGISEYECHKLELWEVFSPKYRLQIYNVLFCKAVTREYTKNYLFILTEQAPFLRLSQFKKALKNIEKSWHQEYTEFIILQLISILEKLLSLPLQQQKEKIILLKNLILKMYQNTQRSLFILPYKIFALRKSVDAACEDNSFSQQIEEFYFQGEDLGEILLMSIQKQDNFWMECLAKLPLEDDAFLGKQFEYLKKKVLHRKYLQELRVLIDYAREKYPHASSYFDNKLSDLKKKREKELEYKRALLALLKV